MYLGNKKNKLNEIVLFVSVMVLYYVDGPPTMIYLKICRVANIFALSLYLENLQSIILMVYICLALGRHEDIYHHYLRVLRMFTDWP